MIISARNPEDKRSISRRKLYRTEIFIKMKILLLVLLIICINTNFFVVVKVPRYRNSAIFQDVKGTYENSFFTFLLRNKVPNIHHKFGSNIAGLKNCVQCALGSGVHLKNRSKSRGTGDIGDNELLNVQSQCVDLQRRAAPF